MTPTPRDESPKLRELLQEIWQLRQRLDALEWNVSEMKLRCEARIEEIARVLENQQWH